MNKEREHSRIDICPFEFKNILNYEARKAHHQHQNEGGCGHFLNTGRGNLNFLNTT